VHPTGRERAIRTAGRSVRAALALWCPIRFLWHRHLAASRILFDLRRGGGTPAPPASVRRAAGKWVCLARTGAI